jgi:hypothetical protein
MERHTNNPYLEIHDPEGETSGKTIPQGRDSTGNDTELIHTQY